MFDLSERDKVKEGTSLTRSNLKIISVPLAQSYRSFRYPGLIWLLAFSKRLRTIRCIKEERKSVAMVHQCLCAPIAQIFNDNI